MIRKVDLRGQKEGVPLGNRERDADDNTAAAVAESICEAVRSRGLSAVQEISVQFDGRTDSCVRVPEALIRAALEQLPAATVAALRLSIQHLNAIAENERGTPAITTLSPGMRVLRRSLPLRRVGVYVPRRDAGRPVVVLGAIVKARAAGVRSLVVASPPQRNFGGSLHPLVLAICALLEVREVYSVGGAQAIALLAYGAGDCENVELIVGSGNRFTQSALQHIGRYLPVVPLRQRASSTLILADHWADAAFVAADLLAEMESNPYASRMLITPTDWFAEDVAAELTRLQKRCEEISDRLPACREDATVVALVEDMEQGLELVDTYGPDHLVIYSQYAWSYATRVRNARVIHVGPFAPLLLGNTLGGPGLAVSTFMKTSWLIDHTRAALQSISQPIEVIAEAANLPAQREGLRVRYTPDHPIDRLTPDRLNCSK